MKLTCKGARFVWSEHCKDAFQRLKDLLTSSPVLAYPHVEDSFILDMDASAMGIGGVLSQIQEGEERVIAYASKSLSGTQRRYYMTNRKLLAVVTFVKQFRYYLQGCQFLLRMDHASLKWLLNFKEPEGMVTRWISFLGRFDMKIEHCSGKLHTNADELS